MNMPKTDDFRLERIEQQLVVTFTPTGAKYRFDLEGDTPRLRDEGDRRSDEPDYPDDDVRRMACDLAEKAASQTPAR